jgi:predicted ATPase
MSAHNCICEVVKHTQPPLIVLTGGPGAGKTAVLELAKRNLCNHIAVLPEAASIIFSGGFLRHDTLPARKAAQRAIFHVQRELEQLAIDEQQSAIVLCDRGTPDGMAYWPNSPHTFWEELGTTAEREIARYHAVIHLRTPSNAQGYNHDNPVRIESADQAAELDAKIEKVWEKHPRRYFVESSGDFLTKAARAMELIQQQLPECCRAHRLHLK